MATPNPFDEFDPPPSRDGSVTRHGSNPFDEFDPPFPMTDTTELRAAQARANAEAMTHKPFVLPPAVVAMNRLPGNIAKSTAAQAKQMFYGTREGFAEARKRKALERGAFLRENIPQFSKSATDIEDFAAGEELTRREMAEKAGLARTQARAAIPADASGTERAIQQGLSSAALATPAILAGGPYVGAAALGVGTGGSRYSELRGANVSPEDAARSAKLLGSLETLTEFLPATQLVKAAGPGWKGQLVSFLVREIPGENVMTAAQMVDDLGHELRDDITWGELAQALKATTAATVIGGGAQFGAAKFVGDVSKRLERPTLTPYPGGSNPFDMYDTHADVPAMEPGAAVPPPAAAAQVVQPPVAPTPPAVAAAAPVVPETPEPAEATVAALPEEEDPFVPKPPTVRPLAERLADPKVAAILTAMREQTGWAEVGGRLIRKTEDSSSPDYNTIVGRTTWIPRAEWWRERPKGLTEEQAKVAIDKAVAGQPLTVRETRLLEFMTEVAETHLIIEPFVPTMGELSEGDYQPTRDDAFESALVAKAVEFDEQAVEKAAIQYENDPDGFLTEIRRIVQGAVPAQGGPEGTRPQETGTATEDSDFGPTEAIRRPGGSQPDLFGTSETAQAIYDREQERIRREREAPPMDQGPGNLFTGPDPQVDVEDLAGRPEEGPFDEFDEDDGETMQRMAGTQYVTLLQGQRSIPQLSAITVAPSTPLARTVAIPKKPIRREHIMEEFQRLFGVKVYQGKPFKVRSALGFFRRDTHEVRVKKHNDLEVTAHEVFHWLDRNVPELRRLYHLRQYGAELRGVSYDAKKLFEGFAEFGRLFLTQADQAAAKAPEFYKAFVAEAQRAGILDKLLRIQERMHQWYYQGAEGRARSKIGTNPPSLRQRWDRATDRLSDRLIQQGLDVLQGFKIVERTVAGKIQDATVSPYKAARLVAGARGVSRAVLNHGTVAWDKHGDIVFTGKSLRAIFDPVADVIDDTMAYFVGRRAQELMRQGREKLLERDEIDALLAIAENSPKGAQMKEAFDEYQAFIDRMLDFYQQSGLISAGSRTQMRELNQSYVPFQRIMESLTEDDRGGSANSQFKRLRGGSQNLKDIFENITGGVQVLISAALRNRTKIQLYNLIEGSPSGQKFAVRVGPEKHATKIDPNWLLRQVNELIEDNDLAKAAVETMAAHPGFADKLLYWSGRYEPTAPDIDMVLVGGVPHFFQLGDRLLAETLTQFNSPKQIGLTLKILGGFSNVLRRGVTLTPDFQIPNLLRDSFNAFTLSKGNQLPLVDSLRGMIGRLRNDTDYWNFLANGGGFSSQIHGETQALRSKLERYYSLRGIDYRTVIDTPQKLLDMYDELASAFEYGTRVAEFKKLQKKGATAREAAFEGREISTDFAMRGASDIVRAFTVSIPFLNARAQGLYRLEREVMEREGRQGFNAGQSMRFAARAIGGFMIPTMALWYFNHDEEKYKALPEWVKLSHWVIVGPDNVYLIPKPFEVGALFATVPEQTLEYLAQGQGEKYAEALGFVAANALGFNPWPQAVKPIVDIVQNRQFSGAPVVPDYLKNVAPEEQFTPFTSESMIRIGRAFDIAPVQLDHLIKGYFGTLGQYALSASDALLDPSLESGEKPTKVGAESYVLRRFIRRPPYHNTAYEEEFYKVLEQTREVVATLNKIKKDKRAKGVEEYLSDQDKRVMVAVSRGAEQVAKRANQINSMMNAVRLSPRLTADEKRASLDRLQQEKNLLFDAVSDKFSRESVKALAEGRAR